MSRRLLRLAVRDNLREKFGWTELECDTMPDGRPKPAAGEIFVAVHGGQWTGRDIDSGLDEEIGFEVTITRRLGFSPMDQWNREVVEGLKDGLEVLAEQVRAYLHMNQQIRITANEFISAERTARGFTEVQRFRSCGDAEERGPDWFNALDFDTGGRHANAGLTMTLTFGGARRIQRLESMT